MIHRSTKGILSFIQKRGLWLCTDPYKKIYVKIKASRIYVSEDLIQIMSSAVPMENYPGWSVSSIVEVLYMCDYGKRWACTKEEFVQ